MAATAKYEKKRDNYVPKKKTPRHFFVTKKLFHKSMTIGNAQFLTRNLTSKNTERQIQPIDNAKILSPHPQGRDVDLRQGGGRQDEEENMHDLSRVHVQAQNILINIKNNKNY